jgi:hypothetical protein
MTTDPNASRALILEVTTDDKRVLGIRGNGFVGIGTNNPLLPLDVRGRAAIAGATAGQEALNVDQTATSGPILNLRQGGNSKLIVDYAGNVGVGISVPTSKLHVESDGSTVSPGNYPPSPSVQFTSWASDGPSTETGIALFRLNAARIATTDPNASRALIFELATDDKRVLGVRGNGNVGIGTNNPLAPLDVRGHTVIAGATAGQDALIVDQTAASGSILSLRQGGTGKFLVDNAGNVGIGRSTPLAELDIGDSPADPDNVAQIFLRSSASGSGGGVIRFYDGTTERATIRSDMGQGDLVFEAGSSGTAERVRIKASGEVSIAGALAAGSIKTQVWSIAPDYVFDEKYELDPLDKVEKFVKKERHLSGVPSAAEIKKQGIDLAEMNMKLLRKVEELTLYGIEQHKGLEELRSEVQDLRRRLKADRKK